MDFSFLIFSNENGICAVFWVQNLYLVFHHGTQLWLSYVQILEFVLCFPLLVFHYWYSGMKLAHSGFRIYIRFSITGTQYYEVPIYICQNLYSVFQKNLYSVFFTRTLLQNYYIQINDIVLSLNLDLDLYSEFHYWYSGNYYIQMS